MFPQNIYYCFMQIFVTDNTRFFIWKSESIIPKHFSKSVSMENLLNDDYDSSLFDESDN